MESRLGLINLLDLNNDDKSFFQRRVSEAKGRVDVLIHPFFSFPTAEKLVFGNTGLVTDQYTNRLFEFVYAQIQTNNPLVIFQEAERITQLTELIHPLRDGSIYIVPTLPNDPTPIYADRTKMGVSPWFDITTLFIESGVTTTVVGGQYLLLNKPTEPSNDSRVVSPFMINFLSKRRKIPQPYAAKLQGYELTGCVGSAVRTFIHHGIDVELATLTSPCVFEGGSE